MYIFWQAGIFAFVAILMFGTAGTKKKQHQSPVEGNGGGGICKNCGHDAYMTLCRHLNQGTLFWIPVVNIEKERGIMCESCGYIYPMDRQEYKEARDKVKKGIDK